MFRSARVALTLAASLVLTAAAEHPERTVIETDSPAPVKLATLTPLPSPANQLAPLIDEDEGVIAPEADPQQATGSLRDLVEAITALPSIDMSDELRCLATTVYFESKGEPLEGQLAVAQVVLNRVNSNRFPSSICGVMRQPYQFSFVSDGLPDTPRNRAAWRVAQAIAVIAVTENWAEVVPDATHFHATRVSPGWHKLRRVSRVGNHIFYR